jgi:hypothetical protein
VDVFRCCSSGTARPELFTAAQRVPLDLKFVFPAACGTCSDFRDIHSSGGYDGFLILYLYLKLEKK